MFLPFLLCAPFLWPFFNFSISSQSYLSLDVYFPQFAFPFLLLDLCVSHSHSPFSAAFLSCFTFVFALSDLLSQAHLASSSCENHTSVWQVLLFRPRVQLTSFLTYFWQFPLAGQTLSLTGMFSPFSYRIWLEILKHQIWNCYVWMLTVGTQYHYQYWHHHWCISPNTHSIANCWYSLLPPSDPCPDYSKYQPVTSTSNWLVFTTSIGGSSTFKYYKCYKYILHL